MNETNDMLDAAVQRQLDNKVKKPGASSAQEDLKRGTDVIGAKSAAADEPSALKPEAGLASFGSKLRHVRKSVRKMTLQQLAAQADISPGLLSQIERGATSPSLRTLTKLRAALDLPSSFFFEDESPVSDEAQDPDYVCRAQARPALALGPGEPSKELLHHGGSRVFEFMIIKVPPHGTSDPISYPSEKGGYVLEGQLGLVVDERTTLLEPGDSFLFDGIRTHLIFNPTDAPAKVLWIIAKWPASALF